MKYQQTSIMSAVSVLFLSAFLQINSNLIIANKRMQIQIEIENAAIAKRLFSLLKERYQVEIDLTVVKKQKLKRTMFIFYG
ncbi:hypothetical protein K210_06190 [Erysipelothrix rhusiopathiae SY1027]|uniref:hypothetical protein n=1 Tax=Erysipelothrix rhusiopathiae TaxID=1648 RepID=UPI00033482E3|nr:hypothetical protein [Erysipelothrix rhusiopathiae]AGN24828.1 hypothetical protein K210_06190 [Erysipelothrix rhusiopathiae SY1027]